MNVKGIKKLQFLRSNNNTEKNFEEIVYPVRRRREMNNIENQKLTEIRDWLLPMLMNGQVKVRDAGDEGIMGMAAEPVGEYKVGAK